MKKIEYAIKIMRTDLDTPKVMKQRVKGYILSFDNSLAIRREATGKYRVDDIATGLLVIKIECKSFRECESKFKVVYDTKLKDALNERRVDRYYQKQVEELKDLDFINDEEVNNNEL